MPKRAAEDDEWDVHKDAILQIYLSDKKPLSDVMPFMREHYGLDRTKAQYERIFKRWGVKKNSSADEWKYIASCLKEREAQGRSHSCIRIRDRLISEADAKRQLRRYSYETTLEQLQAMYRTTPRPNIPPGIAVFTPENSPSPLAIDMAGAPCETDMYISAPFSSIRILDCADQTPWCRFVDLIRRSNPKDALVFQTDSDWSITQNYVDNLIFTKFLEIGKTWKEVIYHPACLNPEPFLPLTRETSAIDMTEVFNCTGSGSPLELLKLTAYLMSNNLDTNQAAKAIVESAENKQNFSLLRTLLSQNLLVMDACAEILFLRASEDNNLPLVKLLLDTGIDVNIGIRMDALGDPITALHFAIAQDHEKLVAYLLDHGAHPNGGQKWYVQRDGSLCYYNSLLDLAVECGNSTIVKELFETRPQFNYDIPKTTVATLLIAAIRGNVKVLQYLISKNPDLAKKVHRQPWLLLEFAALSGSIPTIEFLLKYGFQINASNRFGRGSALVAASFAGHMHMVEKLLKRGANVNGVGAGLSVGQKRFRSDDLLSLIQGETALHGALYNSNKKMVRLLLDHDADVYCRGSVNSVVQACALDCDLEILDMLIEANADVNAVAPDTGRPPVEIALSNGNSEMFERLIRAGAEISTNGTRDKTWDPLSAAFQGKNLDLVRRILEDFASSCSLDAFSLAACISQYGCDFAKELLDRGLIDPKSLVEPAVLRSAVMKDSRPFVEMLLSNARAELDADFSRYGAFGLIRATERNNTDMVKIFLAAGIKPYDRVEMPFFVFVTCIHTAIAAAFYERAWESVDIFNTSYIEMSNSEQLLAWQDALFEVCSDAISRGDLDLIRVMADNAIGKGGVYEAWGQFISAHGHAALEMAFEHRYFNVAKYLLDAGAVPKVPGDNLTSTPLQIAAQENQDALVNRLINLGVDINAPPKLNSGGTGLQYAAINGNFKNVKILLEAGANINAPPGGFEGRTAVEGAAEWGRLDMTRFLLEAGADMQGKSNKNYRRTVYRAWKNGHQTVARMIQTWKEETYGPDDCDDIEMIMQTMSKSELNFRDSSAKERKIASLQAERNWPISFWRRILDESDISEFVSEVYVPPVNYETDGTDDSGETDDWDDGGD